MLSFLIGATIERLIVRRFDGAPALTLVIVFIGLLVILNLSLIHI